MWGGLCAQEGETDEQMHGVGDWALLCNVLTSQLCAECSLPEELIIINDKNLCETG